MVGRREAWGGEGEGRDSSVRHLLQHDAMLRGGEDCGGGVSTGSLYLPFCRASPFALPDVAPAPFSDAHTPT